jgi:ethanolamine ammonia-lyase large subunit
MYGHTVGSVRYTFPDLRALLAKATPARSGDALAGVSAVSAEGYGLRLLEAVSP